MPPAARPRNGIVLSELRPRLLASPLFREQRAQRSVPPIAPLGAAARLVLVSEDEIGAAAIRFVGD
jgi:hypothetical protein